ncbi:caspase-3-like [Haliotis rufescens]|uniref:caspase-3-like n=1 Tax=Haliotis rufescens TaxID=6454 RepID=UPI00201EA877|nr:caspase-3-like [Haliotis rufescens]XP_046328928.2 caspase-3-like [Haliotis rufescens]XP_046328929.2 caspase-3-like [Haliotis rufescens]
MEEFDFPPVPSSPPSSLNLPPSDEPDLEWCLRRTHDVALIYAEDDQEEAFNILTEMTEETNLDVRLQTDECFSGSLVEKPGRIASQCWLVLVVQTHNTTNDMVAKFTKDELIVKIRITEAKDYIRPLCTEKGLPNLSGLASIESLLWDPSAKTRTKRKIEDFIIWQKEQDVTWRIENLKLEAPVKLCDPNDGKTKRLFSDLQVYDMSGDKKGLLFIINNYEFTDSKKYPSRDSSCKDAESLKTLFEKFGFKVETENNLTAQGIMDTFVQQVEAFEQSGYRCFATVILSHGIKGGVVGTDGDSVSIEKIKNIFLDEHLILHKDKPKLFFIQACQEGPTSPDVTPDKPGKLSQEGPALHAVTTGKQSKLHPGAHFYWTSATVPGYGALRDEEDGSYFISSLVNVFTKYAHQYDLDNMMSKVAFDVERLTSRDHSPQIIERKSTLLKQLFFFPGI